ncbi:serine/threonine protein kinase [bacterium]|nr:MAG: serine/threonine protein kinase [bacterium]
MEPAAPPAPPLASIPLETATPAIAPGRVLRGRYELKRLLGEGGMSCVFEAVDRRREGSSNPDARVAVKVLRPSLAARPDAVQALRLEFERAQSLSHPGIVNVFDLDADGDVHFITMERLEGELLSSVIKRLRPNTLRRDQAFAILQRLGEAVAFAHDAGIVHADIKPGNVVLTSGGDLRLFDFGAAWPAQREPWIYDGGERSLQGATPTYASAERLGGAAPTVRDDVYSYCCVAYELLAGVHPFDRQPANEAQRLKLRAKRPRGLTRGQWRALSRGLAFRREDRWPDMDALLERLELPAQRGALPLVLDAEPPSRPVGLSGVTMLLLGAGAFAIAHFYGGTIAPMLALASEGIASLFR